jgi:hypothetical protein
MRILGMHRPARIARIAGVALFAPIPAATAGVTAAAAAEVAAAAPAAFAGAAAALALRLGAARVWRWLAEGGAAERQAVIVGGGGNAEKLIEGLAANPENDIRIVGMFDDRGDHRSPPLVAGVRKLGSIGELVAFARVARIDMLIVTLPLSAEKRILSILRRLWVLPVDVRLSAYSEDFAFPGEGARLIGVSDRPLSDWRRRAKRAVDVVGAAVPA